jgi:hypothetical protein
MSGTGFLSLLHRTWKQALVVVDPGRDVLLHDFFAESHSLGELGGAVRPVRSHSPFPLGNSIGDEECWHRPVGEPLEVSNCGIPSAVREVIYYVPKVACCHVVHACGLEIFVQLVRKSDNRAVPQVRQARSIEHGPYCVIDAREMAPLALGRSVRDNSQSMTQPAGREACIAAESLNDERTFAEVDGDLSQVREPLPESSTVASLV